MGNTITEQVSFAIPSPVFVQWPTPKPLLQLSKEGFVHWMCLSWQLLSACDWFSKRTSSAIKEKPLQRSAVGYSGESIYGTSMIADNQNNRSVVEPDLMLHLNSTLYSELHTNNTRRRKVGKTHTFLHSIKRSSAGISLVYFGVHLSTVISADLADNSVVNHLPMKTQLNHFSINLAPLSS